MTQNTVKMMAHGGVERGRSHDGDLAGLTRGTTDVNGADGVDGTRQQTKMDQESEVESLRQASEVVPED